MTARPRTLSDLACRLAFERTTAALTREITFPILPDMDTGTLQEPTNPHPDGRPWLKACKECALRQSDPQMLGDNYQRWIAAGIPDRLFYCVHRDDNGMHRVCACYATLHPEQAIQSGTVSSSPGSPTPAANAAARAAGDNGITREAPLSPASSYQELERV